MAIKLDQIVSHVEQVHFKLAPNNHPTYFITTASNDGSNKVNN